MDTTIQKNEEVSDEGILKNKTKHMNIFFSHILCTIELHKMYKTIGLDDANFVSNIKGIIITSQSHICFLLTIRPAKRRRI